MASQLQPSLPLSLALMYVFHAHKGNWRKIAPDFPNIKRFDSTFVFKENHILIFSEKDIFPKEISTFNIIFYCSSTNICVEHKSQRTQETNTKISLFSVNFLKNSFIFLYSIYVCVHIYTCERSCVHRWMHICVETRDWCLWFLYPHCTLVFEVRSVTEPEISDLAGLAVQWTPGLCLSPVPKHLAYSWVQPCPAFMWVLGIQTQSLLFTWQVLYQLSYFPNPWRYLLWNSCWSV